MAKQQKHIDDLFKDHLGDAKLPLAGGEWDAILAELHPKKKKRFLWWLWLFPALMVIGGIWYASAKTFSSEEVNLDHEVLEKIPQSNNPIFEGNNTGHKLEAEEISNTEIATVSGKDIINTSLERSQPSEFHSTPVPQQSGTSKLSEKIESDISTTDKPVEAVLDTTGNTKTSFDKIIHTLKSKSAELSTITEVSILDVDFKANNLLVKNMSPFTVAPLPNNSALTNLKIGVVTGGHLNNQSITTEGQDFSKYQSLRNINESSRIAPDFSIILKTNIKSITVSSGLSYIARTQELNKRDGEYAFTYQLYDSIPYLNPQGEIVRYLPFNFRDTVVTGQITRPTYNYVTLPIGIGKEFYLGQKWSLEAKLNSNFGYLVSAKGNSIKENGGIQTLNAKNLNRLFVNGGVEFGVNYNINNFWSLNVNTRVNRDLTDALKSPNISQKMTTYGLGIGIFYSIKR
ncbi:MAG: hypothetical protein COA58_05680 [Bacteroidetes bacterium]|nr:MAG: hypothetical protein COA58_05680 [Bacteroidota bacterium]